MPGRVTFILNEPRNPHNIGASARGMANFGFRDLVVVNPYEAAWRETRAAVKAAEVVLRAKKRATLRSAIRGAHLVVGTSAGTGRSGDAPWIGLDELRVLVGRQRAAGKAVAVVFGSERFGLSNDDLSLCHRVLRIPTVAACPSMNLAQAVAVVACALGTEADAPVALPARAAAPIAVENLERLVDRGAAALSAARLMKGWSPAQARLRLRKSLRAWSLSAADAALLHSVFGWVLRRAAPASPR